MKKIIAGLMISIVSPMGTLAQNVKVVKATAQNWAGGIAGHSGSNTNISIQSSVTIEIDSLYVKEGLNTINGYEFNTPCTGQWTLRTDSLHHMYYISRVLSHYERLNHTEDPYEEGGELLKKKNAKKNTEIKCNNVTTARQFDGSALVTYYYKGHKCFVIVKEIEQLRSVSYP